MPIALNGDLGIDIAANIDVERPACPCTLCSASSIKLPVELGEVEVEPAVVDRDSWTVEHELVVEVTDA